MDLAPVMIEHRRDHKFVNRKPSKGCGLVKSDGKACGRAKTNPLHHGPPPSLNVQGSGANHFAYQNAKKAWQAMLVEKLALSDLPHGLAGVMVEGLCCFPDRITRDQGNFRYFIEKALGDALVEGDPLNDLPGWIEDDDWDRYEFGQLAKTYTKGESWIQLTIFPRLQPAEPEVDPLSLQGSLLESAVA
jgi:hypothetical protein